MLAGRLPSGFRGLHGLFQNYKILGWVFCLILLTTFVSFACIAFLPQRKKEKEKDVFIRGLLIRG